METPSCSLRSFSSLLAESHPNQSLCHRGDDSQSAGGNLDSEIISSRRYNRGPVRRRAHLSPLPPIGQRFTPRNPPAARRESAQGLAHVCNGSIHSACCVGACRRACRRLNIHPSASFHLPAFVCLKILNTVGLISALLSLHRRRRM